MTRLTYMTTAVTRLIVAVLLALLLVPATTRAQDVVVYYHTDAIGSVRATTDATGALIARYDFLPFGEAWLPPTTPDRRQFAGKERDVETGLDYFCARYHMSATGRFTTVDPVMNVEAAMTDPQRWSRYAYARNNPLKFIDPDGRDPRLAGAVIGAVVYVGWNAYVNVQRGRPWYENVVNEAGKGLLVGLTVGIAGPALAAAPAAELGISAGAAGAAAGGARALDPNRLNHIFGKAEHALDDFVRASGGQEQAFNRIQQAANAALREGRLVPGPNGVLPGGNAGVILDVGGTQIRLIGGRVVDGVVEIASASRRGLR